MFILILVIQIYIALDKPFYYEKNDDIYNSSFINKECKISDKDDLCLDH